MPLIVWGAIAVGGLLGLGYTADKVGEASESTAKLAKWAAVAGGVYLAYSAAKSAGALK